MHTKFLSPVFKTTISRAVDYFKKQKCQIVGTEENCRPENTSSLCPFPSTIFGKKVFFLKEEINLSFF